MIAVIALVVALFGGVPGLLSIWSYYLESPKFVANLSSIVVGVPDDQSGNPDSSSSGLFMLVTVSNDGKKPLSPMTFDCFVRHDRQWLQLERILVPKDFRVQGENRDFRGEDLAAKDLQRYTGSIAYGEAVDGCLCFIARRLDRDALDRIVHTPNSLKLVCEDVSRRKYERILTLDLTETKTGTAFPRHGVFLEPKSEGNTPSHERSQNDQDR
jgi:hypothetical protein